MSGRTRRARALLVGAALGLTLGLTATMLATTPAAPRAATAWAAPTPIKPELVREGSELVAIKDVKLRQATIAKGSRVKVREITRRNGQPVAVSLELKDGHVLRGVAYRVVERNFQVAEQR